MEPLNQEPSKNQPVIFTSDKKQSFNAEPKTPKHFGLILGLLILLLAVGAFAYYTVIKEPATDNPQDVVADETKDWKTYRNEEYGFEFKYPENFIIDQKRMLIAPNTIIILRDNFLDIDFVINNEDKFQAQKADVKSSRIEDLKMSPITGMVPVIVVYGGSEGLSQYRIFIPDKKLDILFTYLPENERESLNLKDQILSTFKFVDKVSAERSKELAAELSSSSTFPGWTVLPASIAIGDLNDDGKEDVIAFQQPPSSFSFSNLLLGVWLAGPSGYHSRSLNYDDLRISLDSGVTTDTCKLGIIKNGIIEMKCDYPSGLYPENHRVAYFQLENTIPTGGLARAHEYERSIWKYPDTAEWVDYKDLRVGVSIKAPIDWIVSKSIPSWVELNKGLNAATLLLKKDEISLSILGTVSTELLGSGGSVLAVDSWYKNIFAKNGLQWVRILTESREGYPTVADNKNIFHYEIPTIGEVNNVGNPGDAVDHPFKKNGISYRVFLVSPVSASPGTVRTLAEIDQVLSTVEFTQPDQTLFDKISLEDRRSSWQPLDFNEYNFSFKLPLGYVASSTTLYSNRLKSLIFTKKTLPENDYYNMPQIFLSFLPYQTVSNSKFVGGGYDVSSGLCITGENNEGRIPTTHFLGSEACHFAGGDGGWGVRGYYFIHPSKKYIVSLSIESAENSAPFSIDTIADTVSWVK